MQKKMACAKQAIFDWNPKIPGSDHQ